MSIGMVLSVCGGFLVGQGLSKRFVFKKKDGTIDIFLGVCLWAVGTTISFLGG